MIFNSFQEFGHHCRFRGLGGVLQGPKIIPRNDEIVKEFVKQFKSNNKENF
jgi:hypothetical protein